jgi:dipeptidyl-peptidase 4
MRSGAGDDPVQALWVLDLPEERLRCVADPRVLDVDDSALPAEERARRERAREQSAGIVAYTTDRRLERAAFTLGGRLFIADLVHGGARELSVPGPVVTPVMDPTGTRVAYVLADALWVASVSDGQAAVLIEDDDPDVSWGRAEFIAAEEMGRLDGFWWSPDGVRLMAARVDVSNVPIWHVTDPAEPASPPSELRYPAAGQPNAEVCLALVDLDGRRTPVVWDAAAYPYLATAAWSTPDPTISVQSRDQRDLAVHQVDASTGSTSLLERRTDPAWVELVDGLPRRLDDGRLLTTTDEQDTRRLLVDGAPVSPEGLQIRRLLGVQGTDAIVAASGPDATAIALWSVPLDGTAPKRLTAEDGVHDGAVGGDVTVVVRRHLDSDGATVEVRHTAGSAAVESLTEKPSLQPHVEIMRLGARGLSSALLLPRDHDAAAGPLPVLLDPYGGPHAQRVLRARGAYGTSQWFADAGYAVLVVDGRGSPGRGPVWEKAIAGDLADVPLQDQIDALHALDERRPGLLDLDRVGIRGWSFGGFLAALAVLRRPDVFHAAIAGAPVTDWALYDTHYTERYLGDPAAQTEAYRRSSLLADAAAAPVGGSPERPLLLIHGLADDNVVAAHTLRLSRALLEAGRPHQVLPLVGVTHMTPQEEVAANLLLLQLDFLDGALRREGQPTVAPPRP